MVGTRLTRSTANQQTTRRARIHLLRRARAGGRWHRLMEKQHPKAKLTRSPPSPLGHSAPAPQVAPRSARPLRFYSVCDIFYKSLVAANTSQMALICSATNCNMLRRVTAWQTTQKSGLCSNLWNKCKYPETFCYFPKIQIRSKTNLLPDFLIQILLFTK